MSPTAIAIAPRGNFAYVANREAGTLSVIDTRTKQVVGPPIPAGGQPISIAIVPDQPPRASFQESLARPGVPAVFHGVGDDDPDGTNTRYAWSFGDGTTLPDGGPNPRHTYNRPGAYKVTLTLTDDEGCSTALLFTGQTAYCNGSPVATQTQAIKVAYPGVRVRCPRRARRRGCRVRLRAVTKRRRGKAESAVARARIQAGDANPPAEGEEGIHPEAGQSQAGSGRREADDPRRHPHPLRQAEDRQLRDPASTVSPYTGGSGSFDPARGGRSRRVCGDSRAPCPVRPCGRTARRSVEFGGR